MLGFLIYLNKNKYGLISLEQGRICLKYNVKDTATLFQKLVSIYKGGAFRSVSNVKEGAFVEMFNMVL